MTAIMKLTRKVSISLLTAGVTASVGVSRAQTVDDQFKVARSALNADRKATVAGAMAIRVTKP